MFRHPMMPEGGKVKWNVTEGKKKKKVSLQGEHTAKYHALVLLLQDYQIHISMEMWHL